MNIYWISGPPAAGKSTLARLLAERLERAILIPGDDIREWVVSGRAGPVPWTEETERQYVVGEEAACGVAARYYAAGFNAIIDSCRNPVKIEERVRDCLPNLPVIKVLLLPVLEENLRRAHSRTNKSFAPDFLDGIIEATNAAYRADIPPGWNVIDNSHLGLEDTLDLLLKA